MTSEPVHDPDVAATFEAKPEPLRRDLLKLRRLILDAASETEGVGTLVETLKWGQPAYLPAQPRVGSTVRIDTRRPPLEGTAVYFHCQSRLVETFRETYPGLFTFEGNRAILFEPGADIPEDALKHCIAMALTYHLRKR